MSGRIHKTDGLVVKRIELGCFSEAEGKLSGDKGERASELTGENRLQA